ncbi:response regulator transcription factor [Rhodococcus fascians]|uniref:response regulator n=1 Tax=Rhodococcus sp. PML026 TaxID=1356405 RepID=UPI0005F7788E|nr:response regulator transcription factor [Rhodococcus sp. PML026]MBY3794529.1 response regulator transcription factor [Rhodococcus fascians]KJV03873.1 LuxR family transcriptional regulator [Rhodococcus sp. PML026]MBY3827283.1 response regulator transcription factor [Rhodococcus fascians]MBY3838053.1 response regulator transcription factor [Rhodococcus fascians]MBY3867325.1 response regulator transcription factor [Rhodococcus fascians]
MTAPAVITVLIVDDDPFVRRGVADIFAKTPDISVVADVEDGDQVPAAVTAFRPHVVLMDLQMRRVGGLDCTRELMTLADPPKVIAMTAMDVDDLVVRAIEAGAHSFLSKSEAPETFHQSVRAVASGNTLFSEDSLRKIVATSVLPAVPASVSMDVLSPRERDVLRILATGSTNADISAELYLSETTVKTHISGIFVKLGVRNRVEAALAAFRAGMVT